MHREPLVRRLLSPEAYPHQVENVRLVETHISWVFLTGQHAYKVKKPVNLGFLDFSTLERRQHFCQEEVRLNRRFAPSLYEAAVPITGSPDKARVDGSGEATEWAVRLAQFDEASRLDRVLDAGELSRDDCDDLARAIADVQDGLGVASLDTPWGTRKTVAETIGMNFNTLRVHRSDLSDRISSSGWSSNLPHSTTPWRAAERQAASGSAMATCTSPIWCGMRAGLWPLTRLSFLRCCDGLMW
jgi:aminoglycoside phosphotransferase family enzyme